MNFAGGALSSALSYALAGRDSCFDLAVPTKEGDNMLHNKYIMLLPFLVTTTLGSCGSVNYDDEADKQLTTITQETNQQFATWESQAQAKSPVVYDTKFYDKVEADIKTLEIRMEASQDAATQHLIPVFDSLNNQVEQLRNFHMTQKAFSDAEFLHGEQDILDAQLAALITFELSLKPNAVTGSSGSKTQSTAASTTKAKVPGAKTKVESVMGQRVPGS